MDALQASFFLEPVSRHAGFAELLPFSKQGTMTSFSWSLRSSPHMQLAFLRCFFAESLLKPGKREIMWCHTLSASPVR